MSYSTDIGRTDQVTNNQGGRVFQIDCWARLERFLILGHEGGSYYAEQQKLTLETVVCIDECLAESSYLMVKAIVDISQSGRAPKNDPAIFALAYVVSKKDESSQYALKFLGDVCRIGTHLAQFLNHCKNLGRGWGPSFTRAVAEWYNRDPERLAMQVTKYANRKGWTHRDILRKAHPSSKDKKLDNIFCYLTQHAKWSRRKNSGPADEFLCAVDEAKDSKTTVARLVELIQLYGLVREHMPTNALNNREVWMALLQNMPLTAMIRNLGKMSSIRLLTPLSTGSKLVRSALEDSGNLKKQRVHPLSLLIALKQYGEGQGLRGSLTWDPVPQIMTGLDNAFYEAFDFVEPTNKNHLLGVDVSGSMDWTNCVGAGVLKCSEGAAAMAMLAARTEENTHVFGFADDFRDLGITASDSLQTALKKTETGTFGGTDCGLPMHYAANHGIEVDVFCVYTDNETGGGYYSRTKDPHQELERYRQTMGRDAKLAVFGMAQNEFSVADPKDAGQMDFVGFDASAPTLLANFVRD